MKIDRIQFIEGIFGSIWIEGLNGLDLTKPTDVETGWAYLESHPVGFKIDSSGVIALKDWLDDTVLLRRHVYSINPEQIRTIEDLEFECGVWSFAPWSRWNKALCWLFNARYKDFLAHVREVDEDYESDSGEADNDFFIILDYEKDISDADKDSFIVPVRPSDEKWPAYFDGDPEVLRRWSRAVGDERFLADARKWIERWLDVEPSDAEYEEHTFELPQSGAEVASYYFLEELSLAKLLRVKFYNGYDPKNSYPVAKLEVSVDEANEICRKHGVPVRFSA